MTRTTLPAVLFVLVASGCLEREEIITVREDGAVEFLCEYTTESLEELQTGDAMPSLHGGWVVVEKVEDQDDGDKRYTLVAETMRHPGADLPENYAAFQDHDADLYLQFPSQLDIERRRDGLYYHFRRRYVARPWAYLAQARSVLEEQMEKLEDRELEDLEAEDRELLVEGLIRVRTLEHETFARRAFLDALPDAPQDAFLAVREALARAVEELDVERVLELMKDPEDEVAQQKLDEMDVAFEARLVEIAEETLRAHPRIRADQVHAFVDALRWQQRYFDITEDLADDAFEITVRMPGRIVAHNAERVNDNEATWEFSGEMIRDRDIELLVTSVVR